MFIHIWFISLSRVLYWHYRQANINAFFHETNPETLYKAIFTTADEEKRKKILHFIKTKNVFPLPQG